MCIIKSRTGNISGFDLSHEIVNRLVTGYERKFRHEDNNVGSEYKQIFIIMV